MRLTTSQRTSKDAAVHGAEEALKQKLKKRKLTCARWSQETFDDSMSKLSVIGAA